MPHQLSHPGAPPFLYDSHRDRCEVVVFVFFFAQGFCILVDSLAWKEKGAKLPVPVFASSPSLLPLRCFWNLKPMHNPNHRVLPFSLF